LIAAVVLVCAAGAWYYLTHRSAPVTPAVVAPAPTAVPAGGSAEPPGNGAGIGAKKPPKPKKEQGGGGAENSAAAKRTATKTAARADIGPLIAEAQSLYENDQLDQAKEKVKEILQKDNGNKPALELQRKIKAREIVDQFNHP
jgi:hypothetical protein